MTHLSLHDHDGSSGGASDQDTLPPLPHPGAAPWPMALPYQFPIPHPYDLPQPFHGGPGAGSAGSQHSGECSLNMLSFITRSFNMYKEHVKWKIILMPNLRPDFCVANTPPFQARVLAVYSTSTSSHELLCGNCTSRGNLTLTFHNHDCLFQTVQMRCPATESL